MSQQFSPFHSRVLVIASIAMGVALFAAEEPPHIPNELQGEAAAGKKQFDLGNYAGAEKTYRKLLKSAPDNLYLLSNLGVTLFREGKNREAEAMFKKAIEVDPADGFSHCTLGIVYYSEGKFDDAINELTKALAIDAKNATAHNYLGITCSQKGWQEAAEKELETAVALDPEYADAIYNLAVVLATENPPKMQDAWTRYAQALKLGAERDTVMEQLIQWQAPPPGDGVKPSRPALPPAVPLDLKDLERMARQQLEKDDVAGAEANYWRILRQAPENVSALSNLGVVLYRQKKYDVAIHILKRAIQAKPADGSLHFLLGVVCSAARDDDQAVNELTKALAIDPNNIPAHGFLALVAQRHGWKEAALKEAFIAMLLNQGWPVVLIPESLPDAFLPESLLSEGEYPEGYLGDFYTPQEMEWMRRLWLLP